MLCRQCGREAPAHLGWNDRERCRHTEAAIDDTDETSAEEGGQISGQPDFLPPIGGSHQSE